LTLSNQRCKVRKHHNRLFYGKYRYKLAFDLKWAPMLYPTTDENLDSFISGKQADTKYLNVKMWKVSSSVVQLASFIKRYRAKMKFRLQQTKSIFYVDKHLANLLVGMFWEDWKESTVVDPKHGALKDNMVGCTRLPHGKYQYQIFFNKPKARKMSHEKKEALNKFFTTNSANVYMTNALVNWLAGKDNWYPESYFYVTEQKYISPLYVIAGDIIDKVIQFRKVKNGSNKKTTTR